MTGILTAELTKMRKRTGLTVIHLVWPLLTFLFGYLANYLFRNTDGLPPDVQEGIVASILPDQFVANAISGFSIFGFALALIFGALSVGSEYGWGTVGNLLIQSPTRLQVHVGRIGALLVQSFIMTTTALGVSAAGAALFGSLLDETLVWPPTGEIVRGLAAGWLILSVAIVIGATAALFLRGTALAIGLGLVYVLVVESLFAGFAGASSIVESIAEFLPGVNSGALATAVQNASAPESLTPPGGALVDGGHATAVLFGYLLVLLLAGAAAFNRRDVA
ncbi:ABC transporter permease [Euzebya tangerina]|uniref:ABC transporter permease n=1 Tax=Euzebya tangerina TaxID=591198 RepID=UPI000E3191E9|nr:ABC transporter permease [Euzebya tangerina]